MRRLRTLVGLIGVLICAFNSEISAIEDKGQGLNVRIVVDSGHGGKDIGVSGPGGLLEKDLNLTLAKVLLQEAKSMAGFQVRLTRDRDETLSWSTRRHLAERADLWISLHHNTGPRGNARGPRVFYPSGAFQDISHGADSDVVEILEDMARIKWTNESLLLAEHIQRALDSAWGVHFRPSRPAPLRGLQDLECPAVLVEVGFISHAADRRVIEDPQKRKNLAKAIMRGVRTYLLDPRKGR